MTTIKFLMNFVKGNSAPEIPTGLHVGFYVNENKEIQIDWCGSLCNPDAPNTILYSLFRPRIDNVDYKNIPKEKINAAIAKWLKTNELQEWTLEMTYNSLK